MISIDGSQLEGGGQLIRTALSLSAIFNLPMRIMNIRSKRPKPGLAAQHLEGVRLVASISDSALKGDRIGSTELEFSPGSQGIKSSYKSNCGTAGAISLLVQVSLPYLLIQRSQLKNRGASSENTDEISSNDTSCTATTVEYVGGTNVNFSPPVDHTIHIFLPLLSRIRQRSSLAVHMRILKRGYYPKGGGVVRLDITSVTSVVPSNISAYPTDLSQISNDSTSDMQQDSSSGKDGQHYLGDNQDDTSIINHEDQNEESELSPLNLTKRGVITSLNATVFGNASREIKTKLKEMIEALIHSDFLPCVYGEGEFTPSGEESVGSTIPSNLIPIDLLLDDEDFNRDTVDSNQSSAENGVKSVISANNNQKRDRNSTESFSNKKSSGGRRNGGRDVAMAGALLWFTTSTGCILSSNVMLQYNRDAIGDSRLENPISSPALSSSSTRSHPPLPTTENANLLSHLQEAARIAVEEISFLYRTDSCVDEHTADQLLIYMGLAEGVSHIVCAPKCDNSSLHIETVVKMTSDLSAAQYRITDFTDPTNNPCLRGSPCRLISCSGRDGWGNNLS